jgi:hypothetical protein
MPPSLPDIEVVLKYTKTASSMLGVVSDATNVSFLNTVSERVMLVISMVQVSSVVASKSYYSMRAGCPGQ